MDRDLLRQIPVVLAVARHASFSAAARELGMSPSAVSHAVRKVEDALGLPLFTRTTRSVSTTEAGDGLVAATTPAFADLAAALERLQHTAAGRATGLLRLNVPRLALPVLTHVLHAMRAEHPEVVVELFVDDALVDIVRDGFDAGVRLGEMVAQDMVALRLTSDWRGVVVGAPRYLATHGEPRRIPELARHACIGYRMIRGGDLYRWELLDGTRLRELDLVPSLIVNDAEFAALAAREGFGLAYVYDACVVDDLRTGALKEVLTQHAYPSQGLYLYYPQRAALAPKLRAFVDCARRVVSAQLPRYVE